MHQLLVLVLLLITCSCTFLRQEITIGHSDLQGFEKLRWEQDSSVLVMSGNGTVVTTPISLDKGKYVLVFSASGNLAAGQLPHFIIRLGNYTIRELEIKEGLNVYKLNFEIPKDVHTALQMTFDNDYNDGKEDRNIFLYVPFFIQDF